MRILSVGGSFAAIFLALFGTSAVIESTGATSSETVASLQVTIRDSITGLPAPASVSASEFSSKLRRAATVKNGRAQLTLARGRNDLNVEADGYQPLATFAHMDAAPLNMTVWLDPVEPVFASDLVVEPGQTLITGTVIDISEMVPLEGARVSLANGTAIAITDERGSFAIATPALPVDPLGDIPGTDDLQVEYNGSIIYRRNGLLMSEGAKRLIIDVESTGTVTTTEDTHKLMESRNALLRGESNHAQPPEEPQAVEEPRRSADVSKAIKQPSAMSAVPVPQSIRVGFNCPTKLTCSTVQVFTLDNYTRLGLDDEWFSSWHTNSLKAGAIANRSYAVWHIANPLRPNYDICNTTSCQVIDPNDSAASSDLATAQTTGSIVVTSSGAAPFFAEYSAENNLGGCPDGFTGNNTSWPCLADPVDAGRAFNGHGRGMCQWGTQNWAKATEQGQGKDYVWIVNHYYNANGNPSGLRTGILQSSPNSVLPPPELTTPAGAAAPGVQVSTVTPVLQWQPVNGSDGYGIYISKFNGATYDLIYNSETAVGQPVTGTSFTLPVGLLQQNGQYRWNMSAHNAAGYGTSNTFRSYFFVNLPITVAGRVLTADARPLRGATVSIIDAAGVVRSVATSSLGFYSFDGLQTGQTYTLRVSSKRYRFEAKDVQAGDNISDVDFQGLE